MDAHPVGGVAHGGVGESPQATGHCGSPEVGLPGLRERGLTTLLTLEPLEPSWQRGVISSCKSCHVCDNWVVCIHFSVQYINKFL